MNSSWLLARRLLLWRHEGLRVNWSAILSIIGVAVGSAVLIISMSILNGFESQVDGKLHRFEDGIIVMPLGAAANVNQMQIMLERNGFTVQPYAERKMIIRNDEGFRLISARIVTDLNSKGERFGDAVVLMVPYEPFKPGVMMGSLLADKLNLRPGDMVEIMSPLDISFTDPRPPRLELEVQQIFEFGLLDFDEDYIYLDRQSARTLIPELDTYTGLEILDADDRLGELTGFIDSALWSTRTWQEEHADLLLAMRLEKLGSAIVLLLIILVASFNATSTLVMSVMEKYRQIGILRALGASKSYIRKLFVQQGLMVGLIGIGFGVVVGGGLSWWQMTYQQLPSPAGLGAEGPLPMILILGDLFLVAGAGLLMTILSSWYPARYAAQIEPAVAVNYEK